MTKSCEKTSHQRSLSASEVARSLRHFETWSTYHGCEQVAFSDLPIEFKEDARQVLDMDGRIPLSWIVDSPSHLTTSCPELFRFLMTAYDEMPSLFCRRVKAEQCSELFAGLHFVHRAWERLQWKRTEKEKWSEVDFASNVYNVFRSPAVRQSAYRMQCNISMPRTSVDVEMTEQAARVLKTRGVTPDCAIFAPASSIRHLSLSKTSPWKVLNAHPGVKKRCGRASDNASFRFQTTPCSGLPDNPCFEFASSFWEDKKPCDELLEQAYRQNRMATAAGLRQMHSLRVRAPMFGLVWANGTVRAHVDWCVNEGSFPMVYSAPYPGPNSEDHSKDIFHEWNLDKPSDILQVYLLIRNLDRWTSTRFRERIESGIAELMKAVVHDGGSYTPWRYQAVRVAVSENTPPPSTRCSKSASDSASSASVLKMPVKKPARSKRAAKEVKPLRQLNKGR